MAMQGCTHPPARAAIEIKFENQIAYRLPTQWVISGLSPRDSCRPDPLTVRRAGVGCECDCDKYTAHMRRGRIPQPMAPLLQLKLSYSQMQLEFDSTTVSC